MGRLARLVATIRQQNIRVQSKIHYPVKRVIKFVYIVLRLHPNGRFLSKKNETLKLRFCCSISQMCLPKFVHVVALLLFLLDTGTCDPIFSIIIQRTTIPTLKISTIRPNLDAPHGFAFCYARGEKEMDKNSFVSFNEYFQVSWLLTCFFSIGSATCNYGHRSSDRTEHFISVTLINADQHKLV